MSQPHTVTVKILDKEYQVACPEDQEAELIVSAKYLDKQMRGIRDSGKVIGLERIAVMAALNMANDLIQANARDQELEGGISDRLKIISDRVDNVLSGSQQLDL